MAIKTDAIKALIDAGVVSSPPALPRSNTADSMRTFLKSFVDLIASETAPQLLRFRGAWQANTDYTAGDGVTNGGNTYRRKADGTSGVTFDPAQWDMLAQGGQPTDGSISLAKLDPTLSAKIQTTLVTGKNKFNKAVHVISGKSIGNNGVIANVATSSMARMPALPNTSYTFSGIPFFRGLRFEKVDGSLVAVDSFVGSPTNGSTYTTPEGCEQIAFQIITATGQTANNIQVEIGTAVTAYEAYSEHVTSVGGVPVKNTDIPLYTQAEVNTLLAQKATANTQVVVGKNKFNLATMLIVGKGIGTDGNIFTSANYGYASGVPMGPGVTAVISGCQALRGLRFEDAAGNRLSFIAAISNGTSFTTPAGTARISFQVYSNASNASAVQVELGSAVTAYEAYTEKTVVSQINSLPIVADEVKTTTADFEVLAPANVYFTNSATVTGRKEPLIVYLQRFIRDKVEVWLEKAQNYLILSKDSVNTNTVDQETVSFSISGPGYTTKSISINRISILATILAGKLIKELYIGDSITINRQKNGQVVGAGALWSMAQEIALRNRVDNGNTGYGFVCLGRTNLIDSTVPYKGTTITVKGGAEGVGGWTAHTYLRHPFRFWVESPAGAWDLLGLSTVMGRAYSASAEDKLLIVKTCYGANTPVISALSYGLLVAESQISNLGTWTGSTAQTNAVQAWVDGIANGTKIPSNPFFDYSKSGTNRFSITKWLERYKTLAEDGLTRLTVGSTAGTQVSNVNAYDVCTPTHIVLALGENDRLFYSNYAEIANDLLELAAECKAQVAGVHVAICSTQMPGPMFPERHQAYKGKFYQSHHNAKYDFYKELSSRFSTLAQQVTAKTYLVPTWHCMTPLSHSTTSEQVDEATGSIVQVGIDDYNHPGYHATRSGGAQLYGWIAYTQTL
ncbi:hypothetical protein [Larkinella arboricola]